MAKRMKENDIQQAFDIINGGIESFDHHEDDPFENREISAEKKIIKQQNFESLSREARELVMAIVNSPAEVLEIMKTPKTKKLTKRSIRIYIRNIFKSKWVADSILKEITDWVNGL